MSTTTSASRSVSSARGTVRPALSTRTRSRLSARPGRLLVGGFTGLYLALGLWLVLVEHSVMEDALSRVANASYVLYSREPKLANVGFVWTPLPSLLVLPLLPLKAVWPALVEQGLLANIVSAIAMAAAVGVLYALLGDLRVGRKLRLALAVAFGVHPLIVWFGANGMTEALLLLFLLLASRRLVRWTADGDPRHLMAAGGWLAVGYLARYEILAAGCAAAALVTCLTWHRSRGTARERRSAALADLLLVGGPLGAAFALWAVASWVIVGHPFEQFSSQYGNSALVASGEATATEPAVGVLVQQWLILSPLLAVAAVGAAILAWRRRDPALLAPVGLLTSVLAFELLVYLSGSLFGFLRYQIAVVPLAFVVAGYVFSSAPSVVAVGPGQRAGVPPVRATEDPAGRRAAVAVLALVLPGLVTSGYAFMALPGLAPQEWSQVRPAVLSLVGQPNPLGSVNSAFEIDRQVAAYLDAQRLPVGSVAVDSGPGFAVLAATENPEQFVITSDQDFEGAVRDPVGHDLQYLLVTPGDTQYDRVAAVWPELVRGGDLPFWAERADVVFELPDDAPVAHQWTLWRVEPRD